MVSAMVAPARARSSLASPRYSAQLVPGTRRSPRQNPPGQRPAVGPQTPALACPKVHEVEQRFGRPGHLVLGPDGAQVVPHGAIARQHEMVAVVDHLAEGGVVIGAAASAGVPGGLVHHDATMPRVEREGGREPRQARADHMDGAGHQNRPWRSTANSSRYFGTPDAGPRRREPPHRDLLEHLPVHRRP